MIAKISTGSDPKGLARYLHGPGKATPHTYRNEAGRLIAGGTVIAGSVQVTAKNPTRWGRDFERAAATNARVGKPVWHCSLRCAPGDRRLTDTEFADIAQTVAERMGFENHPWVAVRHDDDHIHIAVSRVDFQGVTWKNSNDRWKVVEVMREVERTHGLEVVDSPERARRRQTTSGEQRQAVRTGKVPQRDGLREIVTAAHDIAAGQGVEAFEKALASNPVATVEFRRNVASTGRMNGYSFHLPGYVDAVGEPIWLPASKLDRRLSWSQLQKVLDGPQPERIAGEEAVPRRRLERPAAWEARRREVGAEQFTAARWEQARTLVGEVAAQIRGEQSAEQKWKQVDQALTSQDEAAKRAEAAAKTAAAVIGSHPTEIRDMLAASQQQRKPWTPEMKRQYATAKAQAERAAKAKDAAKWTELPGGGFSRDVRGVNMRLWVSDDGAWSLTSKKDPDRQVVAGQAGTVAQAQAEAAAAAKKQVQALWKQTPPDKRTEQAAKTIRRAAADLTPTTPAEVKPPARRSAGPTAQLPPGNRTPDQGRTRDDGMSL
ncbi:MAG: relaxase/mobilization nuclease domain-containing protein [Rhodococcus sp. (in: high G+C Gram-positive bacteria)]|uniref:relaxase/mobilization nuclease domain-containing protein n=1 Tax=Rhodococcus sp. TaxID=1831 RepID=UPI003BB619BE